MIVFESLLFDIFKIELEYDENPDEEHIDMIIIILRIQELSQRMVIYEHRNL